MNHSIKTALVFTLVVCGSSAHAGSIYEFTKKCAALLEGVVAPGNAVKRTWDQLRAQRGLVNQNSVNGYDGLCSYACGINITQAVAVASGRSPIAKPQAVFEQYVRSTTDTSGGQTPAEAIRAIQSLVRSELGLEVRISGKILTSLYSADEMIDGLNGVEAFSPRDLMPRLGTIKLMFNRLLEENSEENFGHAQILRSFNGRKLTIIEPNAPNLDLEAQLVGQFELNEQSTMLFKIIGGNKLENVAGIVPYAIVEIEIPEAAP